MNAITHAFKQANVPLPPVIKRAWLWLHDHPGKTSAEVSIALGLANSHVSSTLTTLTKRRMVSATPQGHRRTGRVITHYATCIREYELLPMPQAAKVAAQLPLALERPAVIAPPTPKPVMSVLEGYTLKELRAIRVALNHLFEHV